jgi:hypothetical protein
MKKALVASCIAALFAAPWVHAEVSINGFASVKAGVTSGSDETLFGYTDDIDFENESLFAVQLSSDLGDKLSVTAQLLAKGASDFDADFAWAFLSYQFTDNLRLNAGRLRIPFYKYSDFLDVGFAYDWIRTPRAVYDVQFDTMDGISLYHTNLIGDWTSSIQLVAGAFDGEIQVEGQASNSQAKDILGAAWELSNDWFNTRIAYFQADLTIDAVALNPLLAALKQFGFAPLASSLAFDNDSGTFFGLGFGIDRNNWVVNAEYTEIRVDNTFMADRDAYYVSVGHRFGAVTPFVSYEKDDDAPQRQIYANIPNQLPLKPLVVGVVEQQYSDMDTWNLGVRYDFHPSAAFKVQYSMADEAVTNHKDKLLTVGVDLVF